MKPVVSIITVIPATPVVEIGKIVLLVKKAMKDPKIQEERHK
jgi:hypothetical protein